jgi:DNA-binding XRE family transcriptional regulator
MRRDLRYWKTPFARWVSRFTVNRLTRELSSRGCPATRQTVYHWLAGRHVPRPQTAIAIASLSQGAVRVGQIYQHREVISGDSRMGSVGKDEAA